MSGWRILCGGGEKLTKPINEEKIVSKILTFN